MTSAPASTPRTSRWGLIAGNGQFPFLVLEGARSQWLEMAGIALREEASPELERVATRLHWVSLGALGQALELLHERGVLTRRAPDAGEAADIAYGLRIARQIASLDLGQTVIVRERACVAIEAMEGTDEAIERAARITGQARLVVVKVSKPRQDMRFDVPVVGLSTVEVMKRTNATALAVDARRTLLFDRARLLNAADAAGIAIQAFEPEPLQGAPAQEGNH